MTLSEYASYDGLRLAELVRKKEVQAHELTRLAFQAFENVNPHVNAVAEFFEDRPELIMRNSRP
jgi:amidase